MSYDYNAIVASIHSLRSEAYVEDGSSSKQGGGGEDEKQLGPAHSSSKSSNVSLPNFHDLLFQASCSVDPFDSGDTPTFDGISSDVVKVKNIESLSLATEEYTKLSSLCPMVPMLWLYYAYDASRVLVELSDDNGKKEDTETTEVPYVEEAVKIRWDILEAGLAEYPGCSFLWVAYLHSLMIFWIKRFLLEGTTDNNNGEQIQTRNKLEHSFKDALFWIDAGSNYNDTHIPQIWKLYATFVFMCSSQDETKSATKAASSSSLDSKYQRVAHVFAKRSRCPLKENEGLLEEAQHWSPLKLVLMDDEKNAAMFDFEKPINLATVPVDGYDNLYDSIEEGRRVSSQLYQSMIQSPELEIQSLSPSSHLIDRGIDTLLGWGYGDTNLASTYISFAKKCGSVSSKRKKPKKQESTNEEEENDSSKLYQPHDMMIRIFERGICECPTVEHIWIAYANALSRNANNDEAKPKDEEDALLEQHSSPFIKPTSLSIVERGIRNCPYSIRLFCLKMHLLLDRFQKKVASFDGDSFVGVAKEACELNFVPNGASDHFIIWQEACHSIRQFLMHSVTNSANSKHQRYDGYSGTSQENNGDIPNQLGYNDSEEILFIIEDLRECFDAADTHFRQIENDDKRTKTSETKSNKNVALVQLRAKLWLERALAEANVILPLVIRDDVLVKKSLHMASSVVSVDEDENSSSKRQSKSSKAGLLEAERCFELAIRLNLNPYLSAWRQYVPFMLQNPWILQQNGLYYGMRKVRGMYHHEIRNTSLSVVHDDGAEEQQQRANKDLVILCNDLIEFEQAHGSTESLEKANGLVKAKLQKMKKQFGKDATTMQEEVADSFDVAEGVESSKPDTASKTNKRQRSSFESDDNEEQRRKKSKGMDSGDMEGITKEEDEQEHATNLKKPKKVVDHRIKINNLEYPAHPFTINVSNLEESVGDMDLIDSFASCGCIVFARILRERVHQQHHGSKGQHQHGDFAHKGKSKGKGLVQFEEKESAEHALTLNGKITIKDRIVEIQRSHIPAVPNKVPPGCQRINKKGPSENRKGGRAEKSKQGDKNIKATKLDEVKPETSKTESETAAKKPNVLSFHPRGVSSAVHKKKKVTLDK